MGNLLNVMTKKPEKKINKKPIIVSKYCQYCMRTRFDYEIERLRTFDNWNVPFIDKKLLAQTGFVFYGLQDIVKCHFCSIKLFQWREGDSIIYEHLKWSPNCRLMVGRSTRNVPISDENLQKTIAINIYDTCDLRYIRPNTVIENSCKITESQSN